MFDQNSRYHEIPIHTITDRDGREIAYVGRRFPPKGDPARILSEVLVAEGDRLDMIAARALGDPLAFWRICDANHALDPFELTDEPGRRLRIPVPEF